MIDSDDRAALAALRAYLRTVLAQRRAMAAQWEETAAIMQASREHYVRLAVEEGRKADQLARQLAAFDRVCEAAGLARGELGVDP